MYMQLEWQLLWKICLNKRFVNWCSFGMLLLLLLWSCGPVVHFVAHLQNATAWEYLNCQLVIHQWHCIPLPSCIQLQRHFHHSFFFLIFYLEAKYIEIILERFMCNVRRSQFSEIIWDRLYCNLLMYCWAWKFCINQPVNMAQSFRSVNLTCTYRAAINSEKTLSPKLIL